MAKLDDALRDVYERKLLLNKLGHHFLWTKPVLECAIGPTDPKAFDTYDGYRVTCLERCTRKLRAYSDEGITILANNSMNDPDAVGLEWHAFFKEEISVLEKNAPPWHAMGFSCAEHKPDYDVWAQYPYFTNHETLLLSLGVDPDILDCEDLVLLKEEYGGRGGLPQINYLFRRRDQIDRRFPVINSVKSNQIDPEQFFGWAAKINLDLHPEFFSHYVSNGNNLASEVSQSAKPDKREIDKIAQIFTAMAVDVYGYDPDAKKTTVTKDIADLAATMGLEISDDTVRKYLKRGASFLPEGWKSLND